MSGDDVTGALPDNPLPWGWIVLAVLLTALLVMLPLGVWLWRRRTRQPDADVTLGAVRALDDLESGATLKDAVLRCYLEMSRVLAGRGVTRPDAMTP